MGILKLNKAPEKCIAGSFIFSGRPDPTWEVGEINVRRLEKIWNGLPKWGGTLPSAPLLGYKGCFIRCNPDLEWFVFKGVVRKTTKKGQEYRMDKDRNFEKILLKSAPEGVLPKGIL